MSFQYDVSCSCSQSVDCGATKRRRARLIKAAVIAAAGRCSPRSASRSTATRCAGTRRRHRHLYKFPQAAPRPKRSVAAVALIISGRPDRNALFEVSHCSLAPPRYAAKRRTRTGVYLPRPCAQRGFLRRRNRTGLCWVRHLYWRRSTGWRRRPQVPGRGSNTPASVVPQSGQDPPSVRCHRVSSNQSRPTKRAPQAGHQVLPPSASWTLPV